MRLFSLVVWNESITTVNNKKRWLEEEIDSTLSLIPSGDGKNENRNNNNDKGDHDERNPTTGGR